MVSGMDRGHVHPTTKNDDNLQHSEVALHGLNYCNQELCLQAWLNLCIYTWMERGIVRVKCLAQEHSTMSPDRAQTWIARSRGEHTNHEATIYVSTDLVQTSVKKFDF